MGDMYEGAVREVRRAEDAAVSGMTERGQGFYERPLEAIEPEIKRHLELVHKPRVFVRPAVSGDFASALDEAQPRPMNAQDAERLYKEREQMRAHAAASYGVSKDVLLGRKSHRDAERDEFLK